MRARVLVSGQKVASLVLVVVGLAAFGWQWQTGAISQDIVSDLLAEVGVLPEPELLEVAPIPVYVGKVGSLSQDERPITSSDFLGRSNQAVGYEPFQAAQASLSGQLTASSVVVIDAPSATILFEKNPAQALYPASTTKLMTALVSLDVYQPEDELTVLDEVFVEGNTIGLRLNEVMTVENLLKALLIQSGNDAARVLSYSHPDGHEAFIEDMNQKAVELGLEQTEFKNASGLDEFGHQSSARDLAILARAIASEPLLKQIVATKQETIFDAREQFQHDLVSTNLLLGNYPGVVGAKTGTTPLAGQALVTLYELDGRELVTVVLGSQDRYTDTITIFEWVLENYQWYDFGSPQLEDLLD